MSNNEMWESEVRSAGDFAGVFEVDGDTSYFYLYRTSESEGQKIIDSIYIASGIPDFSQEDICVRWTTDEGAVGLFIHSQLWAAFVCTLGAKYGGNYKADKLAEIPSEILMLFEP
jgi:hypothetical protein